MYENDFNGETDAFLELNRMTRLQTHLRKIIERYPQTTRTWYNGIAVVARGPYVLISDQDRHTQEVLMVNYGMAEGYLTLD